MRLSALFENIGSGVAVYRASEDGQQFIFTAFNQAAEQIDNLHRSEVIGKNVVDIFPGIVEFGLIEVFRRVWKSGVAELFPVSFYQDGRIVGWRENFVYRLPVVKSSPFITMSLGENRLKTGYPKAKCDCASWVITYRTAIFINLPTRMGNLASCTLALVSNVCMASKLPMLYRMLFVAGPNCAGTAACLS